MAIHPDSYSMTVGERGMVSERRSMPSRDMRIVIVAGGWKRSSKIEPEVHRKLSHLVED